MTKHFVWGAALSALLATGCACGGPGNGNGDDDDDGPAGCSDMDGDGYGVGVDCEGTDCNDSVPTIHTPEQCEQFCDEVAGMGPGCECDAVEPEICYFGPAGTLGIGACRAGIMACEDGIWSACNGQQLPTDEVCDEADNNCDGAVDEGVTSACGDCNADCEEDCVGVACDPFDCEAEGASGVVCTPEGGLTLDGETSIRNYVIWIANSSEGTVTKINTRTREEEGRYDTGPNASWTDSPSRTSVNYHGDVAVANRGGAGDLTRYNASDCPDADGDGEVETSTGRGDVYAWTEDECWIWSTPIATGLRGTGFEIRLGLDGVVEEMVWTGSTSTSTIYEVDAENGELTGREIPGVYPYGLAMGPDNKLWTFNGFGGGAAGLVEVTTTDDDLEKTVHAYPAGEYQYGITVDNVGRPWIGGSTARYDPESDEWESPDPVVNGGGIACDSEGNAYIGEYGLAFGGGGGPWKVDAETMEFEEIPDGGGHGWAVDFDGYVWAVEFGGSHAFVIDPDSLELDFTFDQLVGAYTYSDMTGFQLVNATNPIGIFPVVFEACEGDSDVHWVDLTWEAVVPAGTTVGFAFKTADTLEALAGLPLIELGSVPPDEAPLSIGDAIEAAGVTPGHILYLEITLQSIAREDAPVVNSVSVSHSCDFIIG
jgi:hypothetical protein